jgi:drug/metabolite transporter (DMT)-like permease
VGEWRYDGGCTSGHLLQVADALDAAAAGRSRRHDRLLWAGTLMQISGVFCLSARIAPPAAAFGIMLAGSLIWAVKAARARDWSVAALNAAFTVSNVVGIVRWAM